MKDPFTASQAPAIPPAVMWVANPTGFLLLFLDMVYREGCWFTKSKESREVDGEMI